MLPSFPFFFFIFFFSLLPTRLATWSKATELLGLMPVLGEGWRQDHYQRCDVTVIAMVGTIVVGGFGVASKTALMAVEV
jgi:hypothetical protein